MGPDQFFSTIHQQFSQCLFFVHTQHSRASLAEQLLAASASQLQLDPFPQHVRDLLRATVMEREIRREKPPKIKDHQTARSTMLNIQDQHRPVKARELELDLPRAVAHQRKLRHSQEDQEARRQRKLDPAQQAARLERAEVRAARVKALKRRAKTEPLQLQRIRLTRSSGRVKEGLLITSRNTL